MASMAKTSRRLMLAAAMAAAGAASGPALADMETLLDKLHEKGVLSDDDYQQMRTEARADRRAEALKNASDAEKTTKAKEEAATTMTGRFKDGVSWESGDKSTAFSVNGRVQGDYRAFENNTSANTFDVRRAYLGAKGRFYDDITFNVTGDFAQSSGNSGSNISTANNTTPASTGTSSGSPVQLDEAYVNFGWIKSAQIRVGQFQMPFSLEKITSDLFNNFQERFIGDTMSPDKLRGLMVTGSPTTGLYYALAVANGNGAKNTNDVNNQVDGKEGIGRLAVNFAEMFGQKKAVYHFGGSYADTTMQVGSAFSGRTEARGITFFTPIAFTGTPIDRKQTGVETALAYGPVKFQGETVTSNYSGTSAGGVGYDKDINTYYASVVWMITGESYADAYANSVFTRMRPNANFTGHGGGWGAWELGLRLSKWDAGDFRTGPAGTGTIAASGTTAEADAITVGLKWIANPNTRVLLNYIRTKFDTPVNVAGGTPTDQEKAVTLRAQFDF